MASFKDIYTMIQTGELTIDDISLFFPATNAEELKVLKNYKIWKED